MWFFSFQRSNLDDFRTFPTHPDQSPLNGIPLLIPSGLRRRWNDTTKHRKRTLRGEVATIDQDMQQKLSNNTLKRFGFLFYPVLPYDFINTHRASIFRHQDREVLLSMVRTPYNNLGLHSSSTTKYDRRARGVPCSSECSCWSLVLFLCSHDQPHQILNLSLAWLSDQYFWFIYVKGRYCCVGPPITPTLVQQYTQVYPLDCVHPIFLGVKNTSKHLEVEENIL